MPTLAIGLAAAALGTAAVGTGVSIYEGERANKQAQKANKIQQQQNDLTNVRNERDTIRSSRLALAQAQSAAENQGVGMSSGAQGGQASIVSQLKDNLSFLDQYGMMSDMASTALGKAATANARANTFGQVANLGFAVYSNAPGISKTVSKVFGK